MLLKNKTIIKLFEKAGEVGPQPNLLKMIRNKFEDMMWKKFSASFQDCLMSVIITETAMNCAVINNMIKFAANSVAVVSEHLSRDGQCGMYLMTDVMRLCRSYIHANDKKIRWRFCLFLNHLLKYMAKEAVLAEELCDVATILLLDRLQDKKSEVRTQAAHALNRLQTADDPQCRIVEKYLFHMTCDPSADVRAAIVKEIAMFNNVVDVILKSTVIDINDNVRKEAYKRFLTYPFLSLSFKQRQRILERGFKEQNTIIQSYIKNELLPRWLDECNNDFILLLKNIGLDNEIVCEKTIYTIFETLYDSEVLDFMDEFLNPNSRLIDFDKLTIEKIFLWKCVAKYLTTEKKIELARHQGHTDDDYIDILLPDLIIFSKYVQEYYFTYSSIVEKEFIVTQLLDMAKTFTIDDVGAASINKLCLNLILDPNISVKPIKSITKLFDLTFKNGQDLLICIKEILNEIQALTIDVNPIIDKIGKKERLEHQISTKSKKIEELIENNSASSDIINLLLLKLQNIKKQYEKINVLPEEKTLVDMAVKNLLKAFELIYQVQQLKKVSTELSLLTDIIQNMVVGFLESSMVSLRMEAIRSLAPYMLLNNNAIAAREHMTTLCCEISDPMTDRHLLFKVMFDLFLRYDLKTFNMSEDLDTDEEYKDVFSVENVLPLLVKCIDYDVNDSCFKSIVVKGFCDLLIFKKVKSIHLLTKLIIIWFRHNTIGALNVYTTLVKFFTSYGFYINTSSSTLAKCYVPVLKQIEEHKLTSKLDIKVVEVNSTLINLTRGLMFRDERLAINAHGELAGYICDYIVDENHSYTSMLVDTLFKLEIDYDNDNLIQLLVPKLKRVIKYLKDLDCKESYGYVKKIKQKFDPILQRKASLEEKNLSVDADEMEIEPQVSTSNTQDTEPVEKVPHSDLFSQEQMDIVMSDYDDNSENDKNEDDDDLVEFTKLEAMKRMSEIFKKSYSKTVDNSISDSE